jgi:hypothetical protein
MINLLYVVRTTLLPLEGKYYGTEVETEFNNGTKEIITIWTQKGEPSERALAEFDLTKEQWNNNQNFDPKLGINDDYADYFPDCHHETEMDLYIAQKLVESLNQRKDI